MSSEKKRWQYRFDNFSRAYFLLREAAERDKAGELDQLAKEGMIQRFEFCMELAWKTMKDYLEPALFTYVQESTTKRVILRKHRANHQNFIIPDLLPAAKTDFPRNYSPHTRILPYFARTSPARLPSTSVNQPFRCKPIAWQ